MAREIDIENLSDDDLLWMSQRSWLVDQAERVHGVDLRPRINQLIHDTEEGKNIQPEDVVEQSVRPFTAGNPSVQAPDEAPYEEWTKEELLNEVRARNADKDEDEQMSTSGNKAELIARLREDDSDEEEAEG